MAAEATRGSGEESGGGKVRRKEFVRDIFLRIMIGGVAVSAFAMLGELLKPKSFAGLFGAAPSVSLATLVLTVVKEGKTYASIEARSMVLGAVAFVIYAAIISRLMIRRRMQVLSVTTLGIGIWVACAFELWYGFLR
jgi:Protein of unknown function (DUF3147)